MTNPTDVSAATSPDRPTTVGGLAELYLGNILYAIELAAMSLDGEGRRDDAAFYRGIGRALANAHGNAHGATRADR